MKSRNFKLHTFVVGALFVAACATGDHGGSEGSKDTRGGDTPGDTSLANALGIPYVDVQQIVEQRYQERLASQRYNEIGGEVRDVDGNPLANVAVRAADKVVKTDKSGHFRMSEIPFGVHVLTAEHPSYVTVHHVVPAWYGDQPQLTVTLLSRSPIRTFNADEVTEIKQGALALTFEPGDLMFADTGVPVHGEVDVLATPIEPGQKGHIEASPAALEGLDESGQIIGLDSFGMFEVELSQNGRHVQVRPGQTVGMKMKVPQLAGISDGSSIPLWHLDTSRGLWVQEAGLRAGVHVQDGTLVAAAEVPHFSTWNLDGAKQSLCVVMRFPGAIGIRAVSTNAAGTPDNLWSVTGECQGVGCVTNAPSGWTTQENVSFKFQVQVPTAAGAMWCDLRVVVDQTAPTTPVVYGDKLESFSKRLNQLAPDSSFCGSYNTWTGSIAASGAYNAWRAGTFAVPLQPYDPDQDGDLIEHLACPGTPNMLGADQGFGKMSSNALGASFADFDRDNAGASDTADGCPASSNNMACNSNCYVAPGQNSSLYDADGDRIDDFCDSKWNVYNPSQYNGL